ncbi:hypothetical protein PIB30_036236 [Stylosanthes scabra]|uniref:Uncharacterized protein n=1 Tax=Stylosanthes scabra TaxID=79078 RepID=A0ABU6WDI7_9FABA|nr:hypothetical protein [Stylosanthes scabra]
MEDLSMFQRPRTVALEDENPGTYGMALIYPLNRLVECGFMSDTAVNPWVGIFCRRQGFARERLNQVEYSSDSGSDGYYSCKEETIPYKDPEWQQRNLPEELFKILAREKSKIREVQKKTEVQLGLLINLVTLIVETLTNSYASRQEDEVLAVTLRSGK